ncbi:PA14 domain-containing protein [Flavihumibacter petaseus]|uniref:PA14 domain-containing protein n=1 Tax=Flavihumibacter petaseus NBRC 106054 TaxID=1220578 RepID=A0A0E9N523_9BACT|nr:PA14 domain-containing protein [Flavihumibacter petaseus]GAO44440.1 hypothetical protein FPE01S_03_04770 [Flavihumibacter petaseus NBRC 106054]
MISFFVRYQKSISTFFATVLYIQFLSPVWVSANSDVPATFRNAARFSIEDLKSFSPKAEYPRPATNAIGGIVVDRKLQRPARKVFGGGPAQPEMQSFTSVNGKDLVDQFTGDFSYSIPLMDVGGYPLTLGYRSGVSMDQEASWVGLGWNLNPGTITRNMRGLPDDFSGIGDSVLKTDNIKPNVTTGLSLGADLELVGLPNDSSGIGVGVGFSGGLFHNNYKGWGIESGVNASISAGSKSSGSLTAGLALNNNSQDGVSLTPTFSANMNASAVGGKSGYGGSFSISAPYSARSGIKALQMSVGVRQFGYSSRFSSGVTFASPTFTPSINLPYTSQQITFTAKVGSEFYALSPSVYLSGYQSRQYIAPEDQSKLYPAYGYMNFQQSNGDAEALLDFNREKDIPYREKPAMPHIGLPFLTYDMFSISGEGTGGQFRAYRSDIGYVHDHYMRTRDNSQRFSVDVGLGNTIHAGVDLNLNRSITQTDAWKNENALARALPFQSSDSTFQPAYFRNPMEKSIIDQAFYHAVGGDSAVAAELYQPDRSSSFILATNVLRKYKDGIATGDKVSVTRANSYRKERNKRTQVISYLSAREAEVAGLDKYVESYTPGVFNLSKCNGTEPSLKDGLGTGLDGYYYPELDFKGAVVYKPNQFIDYMWKHSPDITGFDGNTFSVRWQGRFKVPETGAWVFRITSDDGARLWVNDSLVFNDWTYHGERSDYVTLHLVAGESYKVRMDFFDGEKSASAKLFWRGPGSGITEFVPVPVENLFRPAQTVWPGDGIVREKRAREFRKAHHLSEISVLNNDGKRYVYGVPVYNLIQKEATFAVDGSRGNRNTGLVGYSAIDNSVSNANNLDHYFSREEVPAYAHSFLLSGILSPDYVDVTGNGISDDDPGNAVKFNYSRIASQETPYKWRSPGVKDSANYMVNTRSDYSDDRGNLIYGEKELWYLHSILSKTMVATFFLENREDLPSIDETGNRTNGQAKRLKEIRLYSKADFLAKGINAVPVKTVHFEYSYELCKGVDGNPEQGKLTLKKLWFTYNGNAKGKKNPYLFSYHQNNPAYNLKSYDAWGNYKDPGQNPGYTTYNTVSNIDYPFPLQDSAAAAFNAGAWSLDSILLPSGGGMKVIYESDDYGYVQQFRSMQMMKIAGFGGNIASGSSPNSYLYSGSTGMNDNMYLFVDVPRAVTTKEDIRKYYFTGITKLYAKVAVRMSDNLSTTENIPVYFDIDGDEFGRVNDHRIWIKMKGVSLKGDADGVFSPVTKTAIQFLRLNLPRVANPGAYDNDDLSAESAVRMIGAGWNNIREFVLGFDEMARRTEMCKGVDVSRSFIRLDNPWLKKYGGGHRVKKLLIYDNWNKMTQQRTAVYGQEYIYTTNQEVNGKIETVSSGVATFEPGIGSEESPFRKPIEYQEKLGLLGPVNDGYTEEPLGESLFPAPSVGYRKVRTRSIHFKDVKSANGYSESTYYTAYDFPTFVERTVIDDATKKRYKPGLASFLKINAKHFVSVSQGFLVELNDMHGKPRSTATYAQNDPERPVTYTEYVYRTENGQLEHKRLANTVMAIQPDGDITSSALVGKDVELMVDMREQQTVVNGNNFNVNTDNFSVPPPPYLFLLPSLISLGQREENRFRSIAITKVVQRFGILDSVIVIDKGSRVVSRDLLYDAETGDVVVNRTMNGFEDPVYSLNYPSHWAYEGMGLAYRNIDLEYSHLTIRDGKIVEGLPQGAINKFVAGDELLVAGKVKTGGVGDCQVIPASFPQYAVLHVIDTSVNIGGPRALYLIDRDGKPYTGYDAKIRVIRSGRRNMLASVGAVTMLENPVKYNSGTQSWSLLADASRNVVQATVQTFGQQWKVPESKRQFSSVVPGSTCPAGFTYNDSLHLCVKDSSLIIDSLDLCNAGSPYKEFSACGTVLYDSFKADLSVFQRRRIDTTNLYWRAATGYTCTIDPQETKGIATLGFRMMKADAMAEKTIVAQDSTPVLTGRSMLLAAPGEPDKCNYDPALARLGPMNRSSIWPCCPNAPDDNVWWGIVSPFTVPQTKTYYLGFAVDNAMRLFIDGQLVVDLSEMLYENFWLFHIVPIQLTAGVHELKIEAADGGYVRGAAVEIYNNTAAAIESADEDSDLNIIFSTRQLIGHKSLVSKSCPAGYSLITKDGQPACRMTVGLQDSIVYTGCVGLTDTLINPYTWGLLGNWRPDSAFVLYTDRAEKDPAAATNIRKDGTIPGFTPFWKFTNGKLIAQPDTAIWVWNSRSTLYNSRGLEVENADPLGRFNSGLYGYGQSLPVAVTQNARYRETAFDGFEDYGYKTQWCDTACPSTRHIDYSPFAGWLTTEQRHSGKYSLKIPAGQQASLGYATSNGAADGNFPPISFQTVNHACPTVGTVFRQAKIRNSHLLPVFSPTPGSKILVSAWVKESVPCVSGTYTANQIILNDGISSVSLHPAGPLVEGWQRYEVFYQIAANATQLAISLQASGSNDVYFDDIRIHPFNANMKSFVYSPVNLRLMAELDENNYATFYEYDDEGTLIRVKKETIRGIQTIKETRSALQKN